MSSESNTSGATPSLGDGRRGPPVNVFDITNAPRAVFPSTASRRSWPTLATLSRNRVQPAAEGTVAADVLTSPTKLQAEAFRLLGVRP